jgi:hypothetical protein
MSTTTVTTLDLQAGDRIRLGFGLGDVTVYGVDESGFHAAGDAVIYTVRYVETDENGDRRGNSGTATTTWERISVLSCGCESGTKFIGDVIWCHMHGWKDQWPTVTLVKRESTCYACDSAAVRHIGASRPVGEPFAYAMVSSRPACSVHSV